VYADALEEEKRFQCFLETSAESGRLNALEPLAKFGWNKFTDLCPKEFNRMYLGLKVPQNKTLNYIKPLDSKLIARAMSDSIDWRTKGAVTPVKDQGQCGSCWAFSSTGNMEGQNFIANGNLLSLSEQELVSCSGSSGNEGCNGGLMDDAFSWVAQNGGIDSESDYPYTSGGGNTGTCQNAKLPNKVASFPTHLDMPKDEQAMAGFVFNYGPLAIAVDAQSGWQTYSGGIVSNCNGRSLDHGVLAVGFDTTNTPPYWIVKNSWSASWGEQGYIRLAMWSNQCGLNMMSSTSNAKSSPFAPWAPEPAPGSA